MRTLWKGAISFGLVNVPVKMYTATERKDIHFNYLHSSCKTPIQYRKFCPSCNIEVKQEEIVRGYEYERGRYVIIRDEDLEFLPGEKSKTVDILDFVDLAEIDPVYFDKSYYLEPSPGGEKAYTLLKKAMAETEKIAVARVMIRSKSALACIRVYNNLLALETMYFPDEIRATETLSAGVNEDSLHPNEVSMAKSLIENLSSPFAPEKYTDEYRAKLMEVIQAKVAGEEVTVAAPPEIGKVVDLMDALRASLKATEKPEKAEATKKKTGRKKQTG
jgi:DNA end-binding protein Ku